MIFFIQVVGHKEREGSFQRCVDGIMAEYASAYYPSIRPSVRLSFHPSIHPSIGLLIRFWAAALWEALSSFRHVLASLWEALPNLWDA